jgi:glyoxylase-like metal-dependent hydrolase (beta-lactamase superfamily II)
MIFYETGKIVDGLYMLGTAAMPVYLVDGQNPAVFDAGMAYLGDIYVKAIRAALGSRLLRYCFLTHSHFDHCGSVSVFKNHFPALRVLASDKIRHVMSRPHALDLIDRLTQAAYQAAGPQGADSAKFDRFEPFEVDRVLKDGDVFEISDDLRIEVLETPGHTWDTLSYYIPEKKILICSEAAGMPDHTGYIVSDCLVDYDRYLESMLRLSRLEVDVLCLGHSRAYTGEDVKTHFRRSIAQCQEFLKLVEASLDEADGKIQEAVKRIKKIEYDDKSGFMQLEAAYVLNLEARVKAIQKRMKNFRN